MFGAKKTFSAIDVVNTVLKGGQYADRSGAIVLSKKDGRKTVNTGLLYVEKGKIYAAEVEHNNLSMGTRILTAGSIKQDDFDDMKAHFSGNLNHPGILNYLLEQHLLTDKQALNFEKEYFLSYVEEILSWDNAVGTWQNGLHHDNTAIKVPVSLDDIYRILKKRKTLYYNFFDFTSRFFKPHDLTSLVFTSHSRIPTGVRQEGIRLHELSRNGITIQGATEITGITNHAIFKLLLGFWEVGIVDISLNGKSISYEYAEKVRNLGIGEDEPDANDFKPAEENSFDADDSETFVVDEESYSAANNFSNPEDVIIDMVVDADGNTVFAPESPEVPYPEEFPTEDDEAASEEVIYDTVIVEDEESAAPDENIVDQSGAESSSGLLELETTPDAPEEDEDFLPRESPVFLIHQKLEQLGTEREAAEEKLDSIVAERTEQEHGIALLSDRLRKLTEQIEEEKVVLRELRNQEEAQRDVCSALDAQMEETITSFQYGH